MSDIWIIRIQYSNETFLLLKLFFVLFLVIWFFLVFVGPLLIFWKFFNSFLLFWKYLIHCQYFGSPFSIFWSFLARLNMDKFLFVLYKTHICSFSFIKRIQRKKPLTKKIFLCVYYQYFEVAPKISWDANRHA